MSAAVLMSDSVDFVRDVVRVFKAAADKKNALAMSRYMKNKFPFYGIKSPLRAELSAEFFIRFKELDQVSWREVVWELWCEDERELQYLSMELLFRRKKDYQPTDILLFERLILTKSWWDTVDFLSSSVLGAYFKKYPEKVQAITRRWMANDSFWLNRSCLLFQLKYRDSTNADLLYEFCRRLAGEKEFFIRKGIGWALRQYSKYDPESVKSFVLEHPLSALSRKEALRLLT